MFVRGGEICVPCDLFQASNKQIHAMQQRRACEIYKLGGGSMYVLFHPYLGKGLKPPTR